MKIGVLNDMMAATLRYYKADGSVPEARVEGDPLKGEQLVIHWSQLREESLFFLVELEKKCFLSDLVLMLGDAGAPHTITVWDAARTRILCKHCAETGENISKKELALQIGEELSSFVIEWSCYFSYVDILGIKMYGAEGEGKLLLPTPLQMEIKEGTLAPATLATLSADSDTARAAAAVICDRFAEELGIICKQAEQGALILVTDTALPDNAYRLSLRKDGATLTAKDLRGFVYGAENILKLADGQGIPCCEISDAPYMPFRGVHLMLPGAQELEFAKRLIRHVVSPMGYNAVILEIAGGMRFDSHPEINEAVVDAKQRARRGEWPAFPHASVGGESILEKEDAASLADYIRSFGIDVIPEVQSLGHVQFMTLAHPEIAERDDSAEEIVDELAADVPPRRFYAHCYCPSNERSYEILFDLMDEIIEVFKPQKYLHIGHDEVYQIGVCPVCRGKDPARLFADDVQRIYDHVKATGLQTMMWSDMLQPVTKYLTPAAADLLPKDILMLDFIWYFHMDKDIEQNLLDKGFSVAIGNLYSSHFPRFEKRIRQKGMCGGQISSWVATNEYAMAKEGKIYDFLFTSQLLWSESYTSRLSLAYDRILKQMIPHVRARLRGESPVTGKETLLYEGDSRPPFPGEGVKKLSLHARCAALRFEHVASKKLTRTPWGALDELGIYRITYADGTVQELPIRYGECIGHWERRQNEPLKGSYYRHTGYFCTYFTDGIESKLPDGTPVCVYRYEWRNPYPEKEIVSLTLCENGNYDTKVHLLRLLAAEE
ncbi:MAG: family 20 glycosylhydrolase [Clostridia bacterium]|nr:family 20 glycosylhydrolase [Clostridia bacterium]